MQQQDNHEYPFLYQRQTCHQVQPNQDRKSGSAGMPRSEERFSRNAETDLVCRLLLEKKKTNMQAKVPESLRGQPGVFTSPKQWTDRAYIMNDQVRANHLDPRKVWFNSNLDA